VWPGSRYAERGRHFDADVDVDDKNDVIFVCRDDCQSRVFFNRNLQGEGQPGYSCVSGKTRLLCLR
jgi:hypothetical protein